MADDTTITDHQADLTRLGVVLTEGKQITEFITAMRDDDSGSVRIVQFRQGPDTDDGPLEEAVLKLDQAGAMILRDALLALFPLPAPSRQEQLRTMPYAEYLQTPEWEALRRGALHAASYRCQLCNAKDTQLQVHHRTYERRGQEHPADLIVLCRACHARQHGALDP